MKLFAYLELKLGIYTWNLINKGIGFVVVVCTMVTIIWKTEIVEKCMNRACLKMKLATHYTHVHAQACC